MTIFFRYKTNDEIPDSLYKKSETLSGRAMAVGDGDGLRLYHQPFFSCSTVPRRLPADQLSDQTIKIRLAGIDAPEIGYGNKKGQPFAEEARDFLRSKLNNKQIKCTLHGKDQYGRAVCSVFIKKWIFFETNISLELVKRGYATVYTSSGAKYGGIEKKLVAAEKNAKNKKIGLWSQSMDTLESPTEYKRRLKALS